MAARPSDLAENLPLSLDWRQRGVLLSPVRSQGKSEFCWGYAVSACLEATHNSKEQDGTKRVQLSVQELLNCVPTAKEGTVANLKKVYNYIANNNGLSLEEDCPYKGGKKLPCLPKKNEHRAIQIQFGIEVRNVDEGVLLGLIAQHPISATLVPTEQLAICAKNNQIYEGAPEVPSVRVIEHSVLISGYGTEPDGRNYFLIRNSYGKDWGDGGYCKVIRQSTSNKRSIFTSYSYPVL